MIIYTPFWKTLKKSGESWYTLKKIITSLTVHFPNYAIIKECLCRPSMIYAEY